jgi:hypothetical protein
VGFFSSRRKKESAIPDSANEQALGSFANPEGQAVVGQQVGGGMPNVQGMGVGDTLAMLTQLGPAIQQAIASGNVQVTQGQPQVIDMRGSGLREQILGIMGQHGIDATPGATGQTVDASAYGNMQQQILEALHQHGISPNPAAANPEEMAQMQQELMGVLAKHGINPGSGWSTGDSPQIPPQGEGGAT